MADYIRNNHSNPVIGKGHVIVVVPTYVIRWLVIVVEQVPW